MNSKFKIFLPWIFLYLSIILFATYAYFSIQGNASGIIISGAVIAFLTFWVTIISALLQASPQIDLKQFIKNTWYGAVQIGVVMLLLTSLTINVFLWHSLQDRNAVPVDDAQTPTVASRSSPVSATDDITAVFTFMQQICIHMSKGEYQQIFANYTTSGYQQDNNASDAKEIFGFASKGGIIQCNSPSKDHIVFYLPLHSIINCVLHLQDGTGKNFVHKYYLTKLDNGQWKIGASESASAVETNADPQCTDKSTS